jgi:hypothetical protein
MDKNYKSNKTYRRVKNIGLSLALLAGIGWCTNRMSNYYSPLTEQNFNNAKWYESSATPNAAYNFEKIPHNRMVRDFYFEQVKKRNRGSLENAHLYPDLDKNGKVAQ